MHMLIGRPVCNISRLSLKRQFQGRVVRAHDHKTRIAAGPTVTVPVHPRRNLIPMPCSQHIPADCKALGHSSVIRGPSGHSGHFTAVASAFQIFYLNVPPEIRALVKTFHLEIQILARVQRSRIQQDDRFVQRPQERHRDRLMLGLPGRSDLIPVLILVMRFGIDLILAAIPVQRRRIHVIPGIPSVFVKIGTVLLIPHPQTNPAGIRLIGGNRKVRPVNHRFSNRENERIRLFRLRDTESGSTACPVIALAHSAYIHRVLARFQIAGGQRQNHREISDPVNIDSFPVINVRAESCGFGSSFTCAMNGDGQNLTSYDAFRNSKLRRIRRSLRYNADGDHIAGFAPGIALRIPIELVPVKAVPVKILRQPVSVAVIGCLRHNLHSTWIRIYIICKETKIIPGTAVSVLPVPIRLHESNRTCSIRPELEVHIPVCRPVRDTGVCALKCQFQ